MDEQGLLFPGVTEPEDRLRLASMQPIGYQRSQGAPVGVGDAYRALMADPGPLTKTKRELNERLDMAVRSLHAAILHQRMLMAKLFSLTDRCRHPAALTDDDRKTAEVLLAAAEAIIAAVKAALMPVL